MPSQPSLGHAAAYINIQLSRLGHGHFSKTTGPFVTISCESGTGDSLLARSLAQRFEHEVPGESPWTVFDRNIVESMLQSRHLSPRIARFLPEQKVSEINASIGELVGLHPSIWSLIQRTNEMMRELARAGNVILVGRGANFATAGVENGLNVRLVAPPEFRADRTAQDRGMTREAAATHNSHVDAGRRSYVRSVFQEDIERSDAYDLMINVSRVPLEQAVDIVTDLLRHRLPAGSGVS